MTESITIEERERHLPAPTDIMESSKDCKSCRPPGPRGPPLIGQAFNIDTSHMHHKFMEWQKIHGDFFMFKVLGKHYIVISHPEILRKMFDNGEYSCVFNDRPLSFMGSHVIGDTKDIIFRNFDEKQKEIKQVTWCFVEHTIKAEKWFYDCVCKELQNVIHKLQSRTENLVNLIEIMDVFSAKIIGLLVR